MENFSGSLQQILWGSPFREILGEREKGLKAKPMQNVLQERHDPCVTSTRTLGPQAQLQT